METGLSDQEAQTCQEDAAPMDNTGGQQGATLKIPAFTREQLDAKDVEQTRKRAHARIHVERVIGCMRTKFNIKWDVRPVSWSTLLDEIVVICCALTNMCPSVVLKLSFYNVNPD
ncbi:hypothetical protein JOB18_029937 [Solea senegalensis]|uniref:DDE Tnp4 domain-containing protein n=1 Tax=Solea senegalensis TaxID=28829 RepID=A0AAV6T817_SOLSE|nr:hypothetical protein JOB18_029937 [Solea senegalensis]